MKKKVQNLQHVPQITRDILALLLDRNLSVMEAQTILTEAQKQLSEIVYALQRERERQPLDLFLEQ